MGKIALLQMDEFDWRHPDANSGLADVVKAGVVDVLSLAYWYNLCVLTSVAGRPERFDHITNYGKVYFTFQILVVGLFVI